MKPVSTQLLTVSDYNNCPMHLKLNSAATVNYISLNEAKTRNFKINHNNQSSKLGDGITTITVCGEITTTLYRDDFPLRFEALVCKKLHYTVIGGTIFLKDNGITQNFSNNTISLFHDRKVVPATTLEAKLPVNS